MSLNFNNINYSCRISKTSNNTTFLSCSPQNIENFANTTWNVNTSTALSNQAWFQIAGTVSADLKTFTTDKNWDLAGRLPADIIVDNKTGVKRILFNPASSGSLGICATNQIKSVAVSGQYVVMTLGSLDSSPTDKTFPTAGNQTFSFCVLT